jgi:hypothetical protein
MRRNSPATQVRRTLMNTSKSQVEKDKQRQSGQGDSRRNQRGEGQDELTRQQQQDSGSPRKPGKNPDVMENETKVDPASRKPKVKGQDEER